MKRISKFIFSIVIALMVCPEGVFASESNGINQEQIWKIFQFDRKSILITESLDIWELNWLERKVQTWSEWFQGIQPEQPDNSYFYESGKWNEGNEISIEFAPWSMSPLREIYQCSEANLISCGYLIENQSNQSHVYARKIDCDEWAEIYKSFWTEIKRAKRVYDSKLIELVNQDIVFGNFLIENLKEKSNKNEGLPYNKIHIEFDEKYDLHNSLGKLYTEFKLNMFKKKRS